MVALSRGLARSWSDSTNRCIGLQRRGIGRWHEENETWAQRSHCSRLSSARTVRRWWWMLVEIKVRVRIRTVVGESRSCYS